MFLLSMYLVCMLFPSVIDDCDTSYIKGLRYECVNGMIEMPWPPCVICVMFHLFVNSFVLRIYVYKSTTAVLYIVFSIFLLFFF